MRIKISIIFFNKDIVMLVHLGMTGKFFCKRKKKNTKQVFITILMRIKTKSMIELSSNYQIIKN